MRILLLEDDPQMARVVRRGLVENAYAVDAVSTGEDALYRAGLADYDAIILDVVVRPPDGFEVCRRLRAGGSMVPILMLTARDSLADRVGGLDAGADDYLVKPFQFDEFLARLRALLRRHGTFEAPVVSVGPLELDTRSHRVRLDGRPIPLTTKEYALLEFLARNAGRIVGRAEIADHVWDEGFDPFSNLIEVYVNRLRRNLERVSARKLIHTIRGAGYMLEDVRT
jgi:two-component system copper resistance phosphate regulon response regulator CusR